MSVDKNYYFMLHAQLSRRLFIDANEVTIDLKDIQKSEIVKNDKDRESRIEPGSYFYLSGGGSFLIDDRYLLVVKRGTNSMVNPGKFSLFTGRSNSYQEFLDPSLCVRELFEELTLFHNGQLLMLKNEKFQALIDASYALTHQLEKSIPTEIELVSQPLTRLNIRSDQGDKQHLVTMVISESRDINCINIFSLNLDLEYLDAVALEDDGEVRRVWLLDTKELKLKKIENSKMSSWIPVIESELTVNLLAILVQLEENHLGT